MASRSPRSQNVCPMGDASLRRIARGLPGFPWNGPISLGERRKVTWELFPWALVLNTWLLTEPTVANVQSKDLTKLRASDGSVLGTFALGNFPSGLAFDGANIWVGVGNS